MERFYSVFREGKAFLPVIHVTHEEQAERNAEIAFDHGADGIFLIGHNLNTSVLDRIYRNLREKYSKEWIGVNFLEFHTPTALSRKVPSMSAVWANDGLIDLQKPDPAQAACGMWTELEKEREEFQYKGFLYFGGIAFDDHNLVVDLPLAAFYAAPYMDVVITRDLYPGKPVDPKNVEAIKKKIDGQGILGLASGITPRNVLDYLDHADVFLVNTGISDSNTELNPEKTENCAHVIHSSVKL